MNLVWLIYWAETFDVAHGVFAGVAVAGCLMLLVSLIGYLVHDNKPLVLAWIFWEVGVTTCAGILAIATPSQKTIYMIAAAQINKEPEATPEMQKLRKLVNNQLDEMLEDE